MPGDGLGTGVMPGVTQLLAELNNPGLQRLIHDPARIRVRSPGARFERCLTFDQIALDQCAHPLPRYPVVPGDPALRAALHDHGSDQDPSHRRRPSPPFSGWQRCRETPANYVLNSDTTGGYKLQVKGRFLAYGCDLMPDRGIPECVGRTPRERWGHLTNGTSVSVVVLWKCSTGPQPPLDHLTPPDNQTRAVPGG